MPAEKRGFPSRMFASGARLVRPKVCRKIKPTHFLRRSQHLAVPQHCRPGHDSGKIPTHHALILQHCCLTSRKPLVHIRFKYDEAKGRRIRRRKPCLKPALRPIARRQQRHHEREQLGLRCQGASGVKLLAKHLDGLRRNPKPQSDRRGGVAPQDQERNFSLTR